MVLEIIHTYGVQLVGTLLVAVFGILGMAARNLAAKYLDTPMKQQLAKLAVQFAEQTCRQLHGQQKLDAALQALSELLASRKLHATEAEMKVLLEAALAEFNAVFHSPLPESAKIYR